MNAPPASLHPALAELFAELFDGAASDLAWILNPGDPGLMRSLDRLSARAASTAPPHGGASIAAHVDHLRYGLELLNRSVESQEDPFSTADFRASWQRGRVTEAAWRELRDQLRVEGERWGLALARPRDLSAWELKGIIASVAHLAYHLGAIRQIDRHLAGPPAED